MTTDNQTDTQQFRSEKDTMGAVNVPIDAYWGAQTERSRNNFKIGGETLPQPLIEAMALVKKAAAITNAKLGRISNDKRDFIVQAADEIINGALHDQFPLVVWQTGSGTQSNMNMNEVIANRANELVGQGKGRYQPIHPNDDVNHAQSTNDSFPTAIRVAAARQISYLLIPAVQKLRDTLASKSEQFAGIVKIGRTHLQDATPLTLGQEFSGYVSQLDHALIRLDAALQGLYELPLGGTAVGTGLNAHPDYAEQVARTLATLTDVPFVTAPNKFEALAARDAEVFASGALKTLAASLNKIANDVRWLASGPRCGIGELKIPENEPGSSIMPGKVNPVIPEVVNQAAFYVIGNDVTVTLAASAGQLQLNVMEPVLGFALFSSIKAMENAMVALRDKCVVGITANADRTRDMVLASLGIVTLLNPILGYKKCASIAREGFEQNKSIHQIAVVEQQLITQEKWDELFSFENLIQPHSLNKTFLCYTDGGAH